MTRNTNKMVSKSYEKVYRNSKKTPPVVFNKKYDFYSVKNSIDGHMLPGIKLKQNNKKDIYPK